MSIHGSKLYHGVCNYFVSADLSVDDTSPCLLMPFSFFLMFGRAILGIIIVKIQRNIILCVHIVILAV